MELKSTIESQFRLVPSQKQALKKIGLKTIEDLLFYFPTRYGDTTELKNIADLQIGDKPIIYAQVKSIKTSKAFIKKIPMTEAVLEDATGTIKAIWFRQPYIAKMLRVGSSAKFQGTINERNKQLYIANPEYKNLDGIPLSTGDSLFSQKTTDNFIYPVYPESRGITSKWFYHTIAKIFKTGILDELIDPLPDKILKKYHLPTLKTALIWIHSPQKQPDALSARKRFAFEEIFFIQLSRSKQKREYQSFPSFQIKKTKQEMGSFIKRFPFQPTASQTKSTQQILDDFGNDYAMSRLLEGDVGSGKTVVAASAVYAITTSAPLKQPSARLQTAYMVPTEILAKQHFESFIQYFAHLNINIALITSSGCRKFPSKVDPTGWTNISRTQLLKWVANGEIPILIGTHSLISKAVAFKNLAFVIIDEQHRFGVNQRGALIRRQSLTERRPNAESIQTTQTTTLLYKDLTYQIRQAIFNIKKDLGLGHKESVYAKALAEEFKNSNLKYKKEVHIPILYRNKKVGTYVPDFVIEDKIIIELKSLHFTGTKEKKQLWTYLKGSKYRLGLLVNFSNTDVEINRVVYDTARENSSSASDPHKSAFNPHLLSMTATPIPRTLALTIYGDLDLTLLDEMPHGRKPIITEIVLPDKREITYEKIKAELKKGRQAYVICPRIEEPDPDKATALLVKSVKAEAIRLKRDIFQNYEIGILHSKMKPSEKEKIMGDFASGKITLLVATSVVEVGVNIPNATIIILEGAERFGLAQLHQLRGRVIRSNHQAYCFVFSETKTQKTFDRLKALQTAKNGFELAEFDLTLRGAGELTGRKQWGISDLGMEAIKNIKMVEASRHEAQKIIATDPDLKKYPVLKKKVTQIQTSTHFE